MNQREISFQEYKLREIKISTQKMENTYSRRPAVKIEISHLRQGRFIENNQWEPNTIETIFGKIQRINIIGIMISKDEEHSSFILDDGTGTIIIDYNFSTELDLENIKKIYGGDCINIIGKPRKFNENIYIVPEIVKKVNDLKWIKHRKLEIAAQTKQNFKIKDIDVSNTNKEKNEYNNSNNLVIEKNNYEETTPKNDYDKKEDDILDSYEIINTFLTKNDNGDGVSTDVLINELSERNIPDSERIVQKLLEQGEIFEIMPGMIKLLQ